MNATIRALHRYPVKSMAGESLAATTLGLAGIPGDRAWAVRDAAQGRIRGAKRYAILMACAARYADPPTATGSSPAEITFPDGTRHGTGSTSIAAALSALVGEPVALSPLVPAEQLDAYRHGAPDNPDIEAELRRVFARTPDEPLPDLSAFPRELMEYQSPPGTHFDAFPLLLVSTSALAALASAQPECNFDVRRFRPNVVLEIDEAGFPEDAWAGKTIRLGGATLRVEMPCPRCIMTTHPFADLPKDPRIMRTLVRENGGNLGVYASVITPGEIRVGDEVGL
jgi:uncharacterized protein YcbX